MAVIGIVITDTTAAAANVRQSTAVDRVDTVKVTSDSLPGSGDTSAGMGRASLVRAAPDDWREIPTYAQPHSNEGGGHLRFASDEVAESARSSGAAGAIAARAAMDRAFAAQDIEAVSALMAEDLVVHTPANRVAGRDDVLGFFRAGRMNYEEADETIEFVEHRGDLVVIMGGEVYKPQGTAAHAGSIVNRRFTDVWRSEPDGMWRLTIRQATITSID